MRGYSPLFYRFFRWFLSALCRIFFKVSIKGYENIPDAPYIVASNHASYLDPPLIGMAFRQNNLDFMAKEELFKNPIIRWWGRKVGCIEVKRGRNSTATLRTTVKRLHNGHCVALFPEGTRSDGNDFLEAKRGIGFIISMARVPVVPVLIEESAQAMPKDGRIKLGTEINLTIGEPITPEEYGSAADKKDFSGISSHIMEKIKAIKEKKQRQNA